MITSTSNRKVKEVQALNRKASCRRECGLYTVEGIRMFRETPEPLVEQVLQRVLEKGLPKDVCLNVNIPPFSEGPVKGLKVTTSDLGRWVNEWEKRSHPMGGEYYWMTGDYEMQDENDDRTDMYWLRRQYATVTPCHIDQTDHASMDAISDLLQ